MKNALDVYRVSDQLSLRDADILDHYDSIVTLRMHSTRGH